MVGKLLDFEHEPLHKVDMTRAEVTRFNEVLRVVARLDHDDANQATLANVMYTLFAVEKASFDPEQVLERDAQIATKLCQPAAAAGDDRVPATAAAANDEATSAAAAAAAP